MSTKLPFTSSACALTPLWTSLHVCRSDPRNVALQLADLRRYVRVDSSPELPQPKANVGPREMKQPGRRERLPGIAKAHIQQAVAFSLQRQSCIWPEPHGAINARCEVHSEKREPRVRDRIDVALDQVSLGPVKDQIVAPERHDR